MKSKVEKLEMENEKDIKVSQYIEASYTYIHRQIDASNYKIVYRGHIDDENILPCVQILNVLFTNLSVKVYLRLLSIDQGIQCKK